MTATRDQVRAATQALGYDPDTDNVMSIYADVDQIIVRRIVTTESGWSIVEDVTIINPENVPARQRPDGDLGPLTDAEQDPNT